MARLPMVALASLTLAVSAGAAGLAMGTSARTRVPCGPAAAQTLAQSSRARVYSVGGAAFGCAAGGIRSFRLGVRTNCIGTDLVQAVTVAGRIAAYASERCGVDTGSTQVLVRNLLSGKRLSASPAIASPGAESFASVDSLVARSDGAAAWIAEATSLGNHQTNVEVRRIDARGTSLLDSGQRIALRSLRLRGTRLTWLHGGRPRKSMLY